MIAHKAQFKVFLPLVCLYLSISILSGCTHQVSTQMLEVGDCFNADKQVIDGKQAGAIVAKVSCDFTHNSEVIGKHLFAKDNYSNWEDLTVSAEALCVSDFRNYYGKSYEQTNYDLYPLFPNPKNWKSHTDSYIICVALHLPPTKRPIKQSD